MIEVKSSDAKLIWTFDWSDAIPDSTTIQLVNVVHTVPAPLIKVGETFSPEQQLSTVEISGGVHGGLYTCKAVATLSSTEEVPDSFTLRVWDE